MPGALNTLARPGQRVTWSALRSHTLRASGAAPGAATDGEGPIELPVTTLKLDLTPWRVACIGRALAGCRVPGVTAAVADLRSWYSPDITLDDDACAVTAKLSWPRTVITAFAGELRAALPGLAEEAGTAPAGGDRHAGTCGRRAEAEEIEAVVSEICAAVSATDELIAEHHRTGTRYLREDGTWAGPCR